MTANIDRLPPVGDGKGEARVIACLDRSSSMARFDKYALVAGLYPQALVRLRDVSPGALVETWWFAQSVTCYTELDVPSIASTPNAREYRKALAAGSAISDCIVESIKRARQWRTERGPAPTRVILWTDGWNRLSRYSPDTAREMMRDNPWVEVFLIGFVDRTVKHKLDRFVWEAGLPAERVMLFEHGDSRADAERATTRSGEAFERTVTKWH